MSTIDQVLTNEWTKIADDTESFHITVHGNAIIALAYVDEDEDPTVIGHVMDSKYEQAQGYVRAGSVPPGFAYAKTLTPGSSVTVGLTVWTEA